MAGSNRFARLPNEIVDRIALFAVEEVQGVFNERLKRVKVDKTWRDLRAVNRKLRKCVESIVKTPRIIIRAGDKVPDDQAKGLYGPLVRDLPARQVPHVQQSDLSGNYNQLIPFERAIFDTPLDSSKHLLRLLQGPLLRFLNNSNGQQKILRVQFMPRTPVNDGELKMLDFDDAPDSHWKYQPVQQVFVMMSYLSRKSKNPWNFMHAPNLLIAQPKAAAATLATDVELTDFTRSMRKSLYQAFNSYNSPPSNISSRDLLDLYHCFDRVSNPQAALGCLNNLRTAVAWMPAYLVRNVHNMPDVGSNMALDNSQTLNAPSTSPDTTPSDAFSITRLAPPTNPVIDHWRSPNGQLTQAVKEANVLSLFPADDKYMRSEYATIRTLIDGMDATLKAPHRLRPDLADLRNGPLAEFWRLVPECRRDAQACMMIAYAEDERRAKAVAAGTVVEDVDKECEWGDEQAVDPEEWAKQIENDDGEDGGDNETGDENTNDGCDAGDAPAYCSNVEGGQDGQDDEITLPLETLNLSD